MCSADSQLKSAKKTEIAPLKRKSPSGCGEQHICKKLCLGLKMASGQSKCSVKVQSGEHSLGGLWNSPEGNSLRTHMSMSQILRKQRKYNWSSSSHLVGEDIDCGIGLAFVFLASDSEGLGEHDPRWLGRYADRPGVTRWEPNSKKSRKGASSVRNATTIANDVLYRSRISYEGVSINLGNHKSSVAAAAAQDLANLALFGSDHRKDRHVLSRREGWKALMTVLMPGAQPYGQVDAFCSLLTEQRKAMFEQKIEEALSVIGGKDDVLADILSGLDYDALDDAREADKLKEIERLDEIKRASKERARKMRKARRLEKEKQSSIENAPCSPSRAMVLPIDKHGFVFGGDHGMYGISEIGGFFWKREMCTNTALPSQTILRREIHRDWLLSSEGRPKESCVEASLDSLCTPPHIDRASQRKRSTEAHAGMTSGGMEANNQKLVESSVLSGIPKNRHMEKFREPELSAAIIPDAPSSFEENPGRTGLCSADSECNREPFSTKNYSKRTKHSRRQKSVNTTKISVVSRISIFQYSSGTESDSLDEGSEQATQSSMDGLAANCRSLSEIRTSVDQQEWQSESNHKRTSSRKSSGLHGKSKLPHEKDGFNAKNIASFQIVSNMKIAPAVNSGFGVDSEVVLEVKNSSASVDQTSVINKVSTRVSLTSNNPGGSERDPAVLNSTHVKRGSCVTRIEQQSGGISLLMKDIDQAKKAGCTLNEFSDKKSERALDARNCTDLDTKGRWTRESKRCSSLLRGCEDTTSRRKQKMDKNKGSKRRKRCGECAQCVKDDCGKCPHCLDMQKFGGPNIKRQSCKRRKCIFL